MRAVGELIAEVREALRVMVKPGISTMDLNNAADKMIRDAGAIPTFIGYHGFPYAICASVNDEIVHGFSKTDPLNEGDIVSLDMDASVDGWCADATITVGVGKVSGKAKKLIQATREALQMGIAQARPGNTIGDIGYTVQRHVEKNGFSVVREMVGHGIGRMPHEPGLDVPNHGRPGDGQIIQVGMTFCIEPMVTAGKPDIAHVEGDPWTIVSDDGSLACHFEHTVAITEHGAVILTSPPKD